MRNNDPSLPYKVFSGIIIVFLLGIVFIAGYGLPVYGHTVPYWLYRTAVDQSLLLCVSILLVLLFGLPFVLLQFTIWEKRWITILLVTISIVLSCAALGFTARTILFTMLGIQQHHDTLRTQSHVYHLASEWKVGVGGNSRAVFSLWQCDPTQILCNIVYSERLPPAHVEDIDSLTTANLGLHSQDGDIEVILEGDIVYVYSESTSR